MEGGRTQSLSDHRQQVCQYYAKYWLIRLATRSVELAAWTVACTMSCSVSEVSETSRLEDQGNLSEYIQGHLFDMCEQSIPV